MHVATALPLLLERVGERVDKLTGLFRILKSEFDCQAWDDGRSIESDYISVFTVGRLIIGHVLCKRRNHVSQDSILMVGVNLLS